jgi:ubiquinone biosynthesis protein Coq4
MGRLAALPEGSLGRAFHTFMDHPEAVPGYMLSGLIYKDNWFDSVPMDDDLRWAFERWIQTHDLMHVVSGYEENRGLQHRLPSPAMHGTSGA